MQEFKEPDNFRDYILGEIEESRREAMEERLLSDASYFEKLIMAEEELIQDYADENLTAFERERFEARCLRSSENRERVKFARALRKCVDEAEPSPANEQNAGGKNSFTDKLKAFFLSPLPAAAAVFVILGISGWLIWNGYSNDSKVLTALNKAQKTNRSVESRITGLNYAPMRNTRGAGDQASEKIERELAVRLALQAVSDQPTAENLHLLGRVYLFEKNFKDAIEQFEKAVRLDPENARLHNDYGAALMEHAKTLNEGKLENLVRANEEFGRAIELDKNLLDARFNQALCIQALDLPNQAREAWQKYLEIDSTSKWADEARRYLELLEAEKPIGKNKEEVLQDFMEAAKAGDDQRAWQVLSRNRGISSGKLVPQQLAFLFVDSKTAGQAAKAEEALQALVYAGKLEEARGDLFWRELARYYQNVSEDQIWRLKKARDTYFQTVLDEQATIRKGDYKKSIAELKVAQKLYLEAGNHLETKLIDFLIAYLINREAKILESNEKLNEIAQSSRKSSYKWLEAQAVTWLAANDISERKFSQAYLKTKTALTLSEVTADLLSQQKNFAQFSEIYFFMGRFEKAFDNIQKNLELGKLPEASVTERWRALNYISRYLYKLKKINSTILFEKEALDFARELNDKTFIFTSLIDLGVTYSAAGDFDTAFALIEQGKEVSETFPAGNYKNKCTAHINLQLGHLKRQKRLFSEAREYYEQASDYYDSGDFQVYSYDAHRGILLSSLEEKNDQTFQSELPKILEIFKKYRSEILEEQNRNSFFNNEQDVYDIAVDYHFDKGNFSAAFDYAEESRSRSLLDLQKSMAQISTDGNLPEIKFSANLSEPLKLSQIQTELPPDVQLLVYSVLSEKIAIWVVTKEGIYAAKTEISSEELEKEVTDFTTLIAKNVEPIEQSKISKKLYRALITPVKEKLDVNKQIFIIPDKVLFQLPFAALFTERYLIEEYKISYSPSANVFLNCSRKAAEFEANDAERLLSIGNPSFDQSRYENALQPLPAAKIEAEEIAEQYENSILLLENSATKNNVKVNLKNVDIVHFAGHYLINAENSLLSSLILAGKEESSLANYEIIGESLSHLRLIILSACNTGIEKYYKGEGMIGASRTFLAANVPLVVASQWSVDSDSAKILMVRLHELRKTEKLSTAEALRQSQLEMIRNEKFNQPHDWAAFAALGGYTRF